MKTILSTLLFALLTSHIALAQDEDISYSVNVSKTEILEGNRFQVTYTIKNAEIENFMPTHFNGFEVVGGPNTSSSYSSMNGQVTRSQSYTVVLLAPTAGEYTIDATEVEIEGKMYSSVAIPIKVLPNPEGKIEPLNMEDHGPFDDFFKGHSGFDMPIPAEPIPKPKKKRKTYKL